MRIAPPDEIVMRNGREAPVPATLIFTVEAGIGDNLPTPVKTKVDWLALTIVVLPLPSVLFLP